MTNSLNKQTARGVGIYDFDSNVTNQIKRNLSLAPVAHTCNPSNPGLRDQEDHGSKPAQVNSS
jgi:hypothetical protein